MDEYQKLTDVEILDTLGSLKKELMTELCKFPEWSENEAVNLNESEIISPDSREMKCDGEVISSPKISIVKHCIPQSPKPSMFLKAEDTINMKTSTPNYHISEVDDICGNGCNNVVPGILPESKPGATGSGNIGEQSVVSKEVENPIKCEEYKSDIGNEYKTSFMKKEDVKKEEVVKHDDGEVPNIKTEERIIMNLTDIDLKIAVKDEGDDTRKKHINFIIPNTNRNCSIPSSIMCSNEMYIGDLKLHKVRCSAIKGKSIEAKLKCYRKETLNKPPLLIEAKNKNSVNQKKDINMQCRMNKNVCAFNCAHCRKSFTTKVRLTRHIDNHNKCFSLQRNHCKKALIQDPKLNKKYNHDQIRPYECLQCKKSFHEIKTLRRHLKIHDGIRPYQCPQCKRRFTANGSLKIHLRIHDGIRPYECPQCKQRFTQSGNLTSHLRMHDGIRPFECHQCKKRFTANTHLKKHLRIHDGIHPYECPQCKQRFTQSRSLTSHLRHHDGIRPFECHQCKKRFTLKTDLIKHLRIHDGIRPYECPHCKARFTENGNLKKHLRIHDGIRPYECPHCKARFTENGSLKKHLRIHDGIRPYECHQCKKRFTQNGNLNVHLRIHDRIRPYECHQCKKIFTQSGRLKIHLRRHDGINPYE